MFEVRELNVAIELWGAAFSLVFIACALFFSESAKRYRWPIVSALAMVFAASVGDALAGIYRGGQDAFAWTMTHAGNLVSFAGGFLLVAFLTWYLSIRIYDSGGSDLRYWSLAVGVGAILMCVLAALGTFYYIDESNVYHRSDWHWVGQAFSIAVNLVNAVLILLNRKCGWICETITAMRLSETSICERASSSVRSTSMRDVYCCISKKSTTIPSTMAMLWNVSP